MLNFVNSVSVQSLITEYHNPAAEKESECLWGKIYFAAGKFKLWELEGKGKNRFTSDSKPSTFKIYSPYRTACI